MTGIAISGTGLYFPPDRITNAELVGAYNHFVHEHNERHAADIAAGRREALQESSDEFIAKASGIRARYVVARQGMLDPEVMCPRMAERSSEEISLSAEMAVAASKQALARAGRAPADVDGVICSASIMERPYPQIAIEVQQALGIAGFGFDMLAACSSATFAIQTAAGMIGQGLARAILCVHPEILTSHLNLRDRETHFIFGDAAAAVLVEAANRVDGGWDIVGTRLKSQFSNNIRNNFGPLNRFHPETMGADDKLITQKGRKLFRDVVAFAAEFALSHLAAAKVAPSELKRLWLHQANINMNMLIAHRILGRDATPEEAPIVLDRYGNTGAAGAIIAFQENSDDLAAGDLGLLCSYGGGYTVGSVILRKR